MRSWSVVTSHDTIHSSGGGLNASGPRRIPGLLRLWGPSGAVQRFIAALRRLGPGERVLQQKRHLLEPLGQRGQLDPRRVEAIKQVLADLPRDQRVAQISAGQDAHAQPSRPRTPSRTPWAAQGERLPLPLGHSSSRCPATTQRTPPAQDYSAISCLRGKGEPEGQARKNELV